MTPYQLYKKYLTGFSIKKRNNVLCEAGKETVSLLASHFVRRIKEEGFAEIIKYRGDDVLSCSIQLRICDEYMEKYYEKSREILEEFCSNKGIVLNENIAILEHVATKLSSQCDFVHLIFYVREFRIEHRFRRLILDEELKEAREKRKQRDTEEQKKRQEAKELQRRKKTFWYKFKALFRSGE